MNASDILKYGNLTVLRTLEEVPQSEWETPNVCGWWSTKHILAHLNSFEHILVEVLGSFVGDQATPALNQLQSMGGQGFNDFQVEIRKNKTPAEIMEEYKTTQAETMRLVVQLDADLLRRPGTLPWYGLEYALDDYIVYQFYGHKREHTAQVNVFKDTLKMK